MGFSFSSDLTSLGSRYFISKTVQLFIYLNEISLSVATDFIP